MEINSTVKRPIRGQGSCPPLAKYLTQLMGLPSRAKRMVQASYGQVKAAGEGEVQEIPSSTRVHKCLPEHTQLPRMVKHPTHLTRVGAEDITGVALLFPKSCGPSGQESYDVGERSSKVVVVLQVDVDHMLALELQRGLMVASEPVHPSDRIPLVRTSSKSAARRQPRRTAGGGPPRERRVPPAGAVAEVIREKGPTRVQSRCRRPPYPVPSNGPSSAPATDTAPRSKRKKAPRTTDAVRHSGIGPPPPKNLEACRTPSLRRH
ncbi:unnamed protein product [Pleuronectes platessa]|uniref:Uncharacterized protein n=1 Tax=Pleuronectes platessa TaxID=8262 RepID=A0A9N7UJB3_PLEPL|nr:unnamed protein product [Pleuronectes platessa]